MGLFERIASEAGKAVHAFEAARHGEARRPAFLTSWADQERWNGGNFNGAREAAEKRAIQNGWLFTAVNFKAREISAGRLFVVNNPDQVEDELPPVKDHPFTRIMRRPNPFMGRAFLWQYTHWWLDLDGNSFWFLAPDATDQLAEIWPLPAAAVRVVPGDRERFVDYYEYQANGRIYNLPAENVCHFKYPNPFNVFRGLSPQVAGMLPIDSDSAMARWNGSFFGNQNVMPSAVISLSSGNPATPIDPKDVEAVKEQLSSEYAAAERKTVVTNAYDMSVAVLGWNARDMDFLSGRQFTKEEIFVIQGLPPGMLDKNATEANATVADNIFKEKTIWPTMGLYAEQITAQIIIPWYGDNQEARFEDIRPVNRQLDIQEAQAAGTDMTVNERRKRYWKLPPVPWGDEKPGSMVETDPGESISELPAPENAVPDPARVELRNWRVKALKALSDGKRAAVRFETRTLDTEYSGVIQDSLETAETAEDVREIFDLAGKKALIRSWRPWSAFEERLADETERALRRQAEAAIEKIRTDGEDAIDAAFWQAQRTEMLNALEPVLISLAARSVERVRQSLGKTGVSINWNLANDNATAWARQNAGEKITKVTETTKRMVGNEVADWSQSSEGLDGLIKRIQEMTDEEGGAIFNRRRAETIAITEATNTYAGANVQAWQAAGYAPAVYRPAAHIKCRCYLQPKKLQDGSRVMVWYTARDERVCTQNLTTPWGTVEGCKGLHGMCISEGTHLGEKVNG